MRVDSTTHRAVALPGLASAVTLRAAVSAKGPKGPAVLECDDGGQRSVTTVEVCHHSGVPDDVVALPEHVHEDKRLGDGVRWWLRARPAVDARSVVLEPATGRAPERAAREIVTGGLVGALLTVHGDGFEPIVVGGSTYDVKEVRADRRDGIVRIGPHTRVELFAPSARRGVDMVILADVSESMDVVDIPQGGGYTTRIDVLRRSLRTLLTERARALGPSSQVALLAFDSRARARFPRSGGMARLDATSPKAVTDAFRTAVDQLAPRDGADTNIQRALDSAAELLLTHGRPTNERVIVLVSDGADCPREDAHETGKVVAALEEPVSVMQHLHQDLHIRLHAVGIGTQKWFSEKYDPDRSPRAVQPDHELLEKLVTAGGGDKPTIGGVDDVGAFFREMATGLRYPVRGTLSAMAPLRLDPALLARIAARRRRRRSAAEIAALRDELGDAGHALDMASQRLYGGSLFPRTCVGELDAVLMDGMSVDGTSMDGVPEDATAFAASLRPILREMRKVPDGAAEAGCIREWLDVLDRLDRAVVADRDLRELARECRSGSTAVPDVAAAVCQAVVASLQRVERQLTAMRAPVRPASRAAAAPAALTPTRPRVRA